MTERIGRLIRTNVALAALCIIALGILVIMFRGRGPASPSAGADAISVPVVSGQPFSASRASAEDPLAHSPLRNMPLPSTFKSFAYAPGQPVAVSGECADAYRVIMIFPAGIDYRSDPLSAVYNDAAACSAGHPFVEHISLDGRSAVSRAGSGAQYYVIRANEGKAGSWYGPY